MFILSFSYFCKRKNKKMKKQYTTIFIKLHIHHIHYQPKMSNPNYYEVLGVSKDATDTEIKKAYRAASLKYHPDRNPSEEAKTKIQEINAAYEVLGDEGKKKQYDFESEMGGGGGFPPGFPFGGGGMGGGHFTHMSHGFDDVHDIFNMMFGAGGAGGMPGMPGMPGIRIFHNGNPVFMGGHIQKPQPIIKKIEITLEQSFTGFSLNMDFERTVVMQQVQSSESDHILLQIPPGINEGESIVVSEKGHCIENKVRGDLHIQIHIHKHELFTRSGNDLLYKKKITLKEALCGFMLEIMHLNGKMLRLNHQANSQVIKPGDKKTIPSFGMVKNNQTGNLIVEFEITFPESLSEDQIQKLRDIL
jgi:DnaJ-class molecular chaperone